MDYELAPRDRLIYLAIRNRGNWSAVFRDIKAHVEIDEAAAKEAVESLNCEAVTFIDPEYPASLKNAPQAPIVLFYKGDISLIADESKCVSVVGSRNATPESANMARQVSQTLSKNDFAIVSGGSKGLCIEALKKASKPVCVLGCGFDKPYPAENAKTYAKIAEEGLLLSEYPPDEPPQAMNFPARNRIVACLSAKTIVGHAKKYSGTLIEAAFAINAGKDVGVIPLWGDDTENGMLIESGAYPITSPESALRFALAK